MSNAKITLLGFYNWMDAAGQDIFAEFSGLPSGIDADTLKQNILLRGGEFEVIYSDPVFFQAAVRPWVKKWYRTIDKWLEALAIEYDPLYNYDRTETWTDSGSDGKSKNGITQQTNSKAGDSTDNNAYARNSVTETSGSGSETHSGSVETVNEVSAFDSASYQAHDKSTATDTTGIGTTNDQTTTVGGADTETLEKNFTESGSLEEETAETETGVHENTHTGRMYGNIGVTTSQQMLRDELEVARFNLIDEVTDLFLVEFTIPVYI